MSFETLTLDFPPYFQCKNKIEWILLTSEHFNKPIKDLVENLVKNARKNGTLSNLINELSNSGVTDEEITNAINSVTTQEEKQKSREERYVKGIFISPIYQKFSYIDDGSILKFDINIKKLIENEKLDENGCIHFLVYRSKDKKNFYPQRTNT